MNTPGEDNLTCELIINEKIDHHISFKLVVIGNTGKITF